MAVPLCIHGSFRKRHIPVSSASFQQANPAGKCVTSRTAASFAGSGISDWHRVERARMTFALEAAQLEESGWNES